MTPKDPAAVALGRKGGRATAKKRTPQQRSDAARKAVLARWAKADRLIADMKAAEKEMLETESGGKNRRGKGPE